MLVDNLRLRGREGLWQLCVADGRIAALVPTGQAADDAGERLDGAGGLAVSPFIEPYVHLDTTQTAGQPEWNRSGTPFEGIEHWAQRKAPLSHEDVEQRARQTLKWQIANGVQHVRSHADISDLTLTALKTMLEVRGEVAPWVDLQIVAFPQEGILFYPNGLELLKESLHLGTDVVGAIPRFEFTRELGVESLRRAIDLAKCYGLPVDVHCGETDDEQSHFLETLAMLAHRDDLGARVIASHTTTMHSYNDACTSRLFRSLKLSGINFVANPLVNIHLQGRFDDCPKRRGITRVKELLGAGINICLGHDDVFDPWYPLDTANVLQVLHMGLHATQMMGYDGIDGGLDLIIHSSARTLGLREYGIEVGHLANLLVLPVHDGFDAMRRQVPVRYSTRGGRLLVETVPAQTMVFLEQAGAVDFTRVN